MMRDAKVAKWGMVFATLFCLTMTTCSYFNGASARFMFAENAITIPLSVTGSPDYDMVVPMLIMLVLPALIGSIYLSAVIAASQSTADAVILMASFGLARDLYHKLINPEATDEKILRLSKYTTALVTFGGLILAYFRPKMILDMAMIAWACLSAAIMAPFIYSLFWKRATKTAATWTSVTAFILAILWGPWFLNRPYGMHEFIVSQVYAWLVFPVVNFIVLSMDRQEIDEGLIARLWSSLSSD